MGAAEAIPVHLPQLVAAYAGILAPHLLDELHHEAGVNARGLPSGGAGRVSCHLSHAPQPHWDTLSHIMLWLMHS